MGKAPPPEDESPLLTDPLAGPSLAELDRFTVASQRQWLTAETCWRENNICSSVKFDFFMDSSPHPRSTPEPPYSSFKRLRKIGVTSNPMISANPDRSLRQNFLLDSPLI